MAMNRLEYAARVIMSLETFRGGGEIMEELESLRDGATPKEDSILGSTSRFMEVLLEVEDDVSTASEWAVKMLRLLSRKRAGYEIQGMDAIQTDPKLTRYARRIAIATDRAYESKGLGNTPFRWKFGAGRAATDRALVQLVQRGWIKPIEGGLLFPKWRYEYRNHERGDI